MELTYEEIEARFLDNVCVANNGCWEWTKTIYPNGYGYFSIMGMNLLAHRAAYMIFKEFRIPDNYVVHHTCGNRCCVNPEHLEKMHKKAHFIMHLKERPRRKAGRKWTIPG